MSEKLKPCPFCEGIAHEVRGVFRGDGSVLEWDGETHIQCTVCGASCCIGTGGNVDYACWNTRAQPEAVTNVVGEMPRGAEDILQAFEWLESIVNCEGEGVTFTDEDTKQANFVLSQLENLTISTATAEADLAKAREVIARLLTAGIVLNPFLPNKVPGFSADTHTPHVRASHEFRAALTTARNYLEGK